MLELFFLINGTQIQVALPWDGTQLAGAEYNSSEQHALEELGVANQVSDGWLS